MASGVKCDEQSPSAPSFAAARSLSFCEPAAAWMAAFRSRHFDTHDRNDASLSGARARRG